MWLNQLVEDNIAPIKILKKNKRFLEKHMEGRLKEEEYLSFFLKHFTGWDINEMQRYSEKVFCNHAMQNIYDEAIITINHFKKERIPIFLLTAANNIAALPFGKFLAIDVILSTELVFDRTGKFTGTINDPYCYGIGKVKKALEYCTSKGWAIENGSYFGDSISDIHMLEIVNDPIVVNPNTIELKDYAFSKNWGITYWNNLSVGSQKV
jgi:phosphoserine phosphatase